MNVQSQLDLNSELSELLCLLKLESVESIRDSTYHFLQQKMTSAQAAEIFSRLDFYYDRRFRSEVLCPMFPEPAYYVEIQYLDLSEDLLLKLNDDFEYAYELALSRRLALKENLTESEITEIEFALYRFLEAYRREEIVLEVEEENE